VYMEIILTIISAILFFILSPSVFVRLPKKGKKYTVAGAHAIIFTIVLFFFNTLLVFHNIEGFREGYPTQTPTKTIAQTPTQTPTKTITQTPTQTPT